MFGKKRGKKQKSNIITKETLCATCATFSFLALLVLFSKSWIFGSVGETIHICLTGIFGYFAYPTFLWLIYISTTCLLGKKYVKNRRLVSYATLFLIFVGLVVQTAMTYSWPLEDYVKRCFLSGEKFPDTAVCGAVGGFIIEKTAVLLSKRGVIVFFSVMATFFACLCCLVFKKTVRNVEEKDVPVPAQPTPEVKDEVATQGTSVAQPNTVPVTAEDSYMMPTIQQRPAVVLSGEAAPSDRTPNENAQQSDPAYGSREFLFGSSPAENYQRNLIFDPNSRVNRRQYDVNTPQGESTYVPSYSNAYETDMNTYETPAPTMVVEDRSNVDSPIYQEEKPAVPQTPAYEPEESYLDVSEDASAYDDSNRYEIVEDREDRSSFTEERTTVVEEPSNTHTDVQEGRDKPYERHEYMSLFSPENPRVFGDNGEDSRLNISYDDRNFSRDTYTDRTEETVSDGRGDRDGARLLDDDEQSDPYTLRSDYEDDNHFSRDTVETRGRDAETTENIRGERGMETRGCSVEEPSTPIVEPPKPVEPLKPRVIRPYKRVPLDDFDCRDIEPTADPEEVEFTKANILATLEEFKVFGVTIASVTFGPTVTRYNLILPRNILPRKVTQLDEAIAISLHSSHVNIYTNFEEGGVTIEVPNKERQFVQLGCMLSGDTYVNAKPSSIMFTMGKDVANRKVYGDISKMIHLLVAGSSGSGKSVFLGSLIISLIYKYSPEELRLILIDPKKSEFVLYNNLPHLMINEIITEAGKAVQSLNWAIGEMNRRYTLFEQMSRAGTYVVNLDQYNEQLEKSERLPKIVIIIDELADLMLAAKKEMEDRIQNLTQKARAAGIHLIVATQRPSTDVITGVIKSNLATRIAFYVATDVDSRVILDQSGAQNLLGKGDFLYTMPGVNLPVRVQSAFISPEDAQRVVNFIKNNNEAYYDEEATAFINSRGGNGGTPSDPLEAGIGGDNIDPVYIEALRYVILSNSASISMIQRKCMIGYNRAGKIVEWMEDMGYISPFDGAKARKVLITKEEFESKYGPL